MPRAPASLDELELGQGSRGLGHGRTDTGCSATQRTSSIDTRSTRKPPCSDEREETRHSGLATTTTARTTKSLPKVHPA